MRKFLFLSFFVFINLSCATKQVATELAEDIFITGCPDGGTCSFEVLKDTSITLVRDEFDNFYPRQSKSIDFNLIKIAYTKDVPEGIMDAGYVEVFYIVVPKQKKEWNLKNKALYRASLIYGRECRCPGETGYEYVLEGKLNYRRMRSHLDIDLKVKNTNLSMLMNKFSVSADVLEVF